MLRVESLHRSRCLHNVIMPCFLTFCRHDVVKFHHFASLLSFSFCFFTALLAELQETCTALTLSPLYICCGYILLYLHIQCIHSNISIHLEPSLYIHHLVNVKFSSPVYMKQCPRLYSSCESLLLWCRNGKR